MSVNKVILIGNVGKDPEVRYLDSNTPFCKISLATSEVYKNKMGEKVTTTEWHNVVLWRGIAEVAEKYVKKGTQIYIEGRLRTRAWDDKDKVKRYTTEIVADVMQLLGKRSDDHSNAGVSMPPTETHAAENPLKADKGEDEFTTDLLQMPGSKGDEHGTPGPSGPSSESHTVDNPPIADKEENDLPF